MTATRLDAADTVRIQVVALEDPARGVRSTISFDAQGGALPDRPTDRNGVATFSVEACDDSLGIFAEPALPYLNTARFDCARDLKIPVEKARYAAALEPGLREAASRSDWARYGQLDGGGGFFDRLIAGIGLKPEAYQVADPQAELTSALDDLRFADAARAAGTLRRRRGGPTMRASPPPTRRSPPRRPFAPWGRSPARRPIRFSASPRTARSC